jgi:hypothetical protein
LTTGKSVFKPDRVKLKVYPVTVEADCAGPMGENEPRAETFSVTVERQWIILHV